jgi:hypothetical protein
LLIKYVKSILSLENSGMPVMCVCVYVCVYIYIYIYIYVGCMVPKG